MPILGEEKASFAGGTLYPLEVPNNLRAGFVRSELPELRQKASNLEAAKASFKLANDIYHLSEIFNQWKPDNAFMPEVPADFEPLSEGDRQKYPTEYWPALLNSKNPQQKQFLINKIEERLKLERQVQDGSWWATVPAGFGGSLFSPSTMLPVFGMLKYGKRSEEFVKNAFRVAPSVAMGAAVSESLTQLSKEQFNLGEFAWHMAADIVLGSILTSGANTLIGRSATAATRASLEAAKEGYPLGVKVNDRLEPEGYSAAPYGEGAGSASAAKVERDLDYVIPKLSDNKFWRTIFSYAPNTRVLTSSYETVRKWGRNIFDNSFIKAAKKGSELEKELVDQHGIPYGNASAESIARVWSYMKDNVKQELRSAYKEYVAASKGQTLLGDKEMWELIGRVGSQGDFHPEPIVTQSLKTVRGLWEKYIASMERSGQKFSRQSMDPTYMMRIWDIPKILENPEGFRETIRQAILTRDKEIAFYTQKLNDLKLEAKSLKSKHKKLRSETKSIPKEFKKKHRESVVQAKKAYEDQLKEIEYEYQRLQKEIDDGKINVTLLTSKQELSPELLREYESVSQGTKVAREQLNESIKRLNDNRRNLSAAALKDLKDKIRSQRKELKRQEAILSERLQSGEVHPDLFYFGKNNLPKLLKLKDKPWFTRIEGEEGAQSYAQMLELRLTHMTPESVYREMFGLLEGGGGVNPTRQRTVMIPTAHVMDYVNTNIMDVLDMMGGFMSKRLALDEVSQRLGYPSFKDFQKALAEDLQKEFKIQKDAVEAIGDPKQRLKANKKMLQEQRAAEKLIKESYEVFMGTYSNPNTWYSRGLQYSRELSTTVNLGASVIPSLWDVAGLMFRDGPWRVLQHGYFQFINQVKTNPKVTKRDLRSMGLAIEVENAFMHNQFFTETGQFEEGRGIIGQSLKKLSNLNNAINLTGFIGDSFQRIAGTLYTNDLIHVLRKYKAGQKLSKKEVQLLSDGNIDPKVYADRVLEQLDHYGIPSENGNGTIANTSEWRDAQAAIHFNAAINKITRTYLSRPSILDKPIVMRNPVIASLMQYTDFVFGATMNFSARTLQAPDAQKFQGILWLWGLNCLTDPLRNLVNGKEPESDPYKIIMAGLGNSSVLGIFHHYLSMLSSIFQIPGLQGFSPNKFQKAPSQLLLGTPGQQFDAVIGLMNMILEGKWNQSDLNRARYLIPHSRHFLLRGWLTDTINNMDIPRTRAKAEGWFQDTGW